MEISLIMNSIWRQMPYQSILLNGLVPSFLNTKDLTGKLHFLGKKNKFDECVRCVKTNFHPEGARLLWQKFPSPGVRLYFKINTHLGCVFIMVRVYYGCANISRHPPLHIFLIFFSCTNGMLMKLWRSVAKTYCKFLRAWTTLITSRTGWSRPPKIIYLAKNCFY